MNVALLHSNALDGYGGARGIGRLLSELKDEDLQHETVARRKRRAKTDLRSCMRVFFTSIYRQSFDRLGPRMHLANASGLKNTK